MPIYEYLCHSCGEEFEALQKFSEAPLTTCKCGAEGRVERKLSLSAFHLQGGGWYKDQYGSGKSNGNGSSKDASSDSIKKAGDSAKKDSAQKDSAQKDSAKSGSAKSDSGSPSTPASSSSAKPASPSPST